MGNDLERVPFREEEINISPLAPDQNQEMFDFASSPFSIKEA